MLPEGRIRKHLEDCLFALNSPCNCKAEGHQTECVEGGRVLLAVVAVLKWLLEENAHYYRTEEGLAAGRARGEVGKRSKKGNRR